MGEIQHIHHILFIDLDLVSGRFEMQHEISQWLMQKVEVEPCLI